MGRVAPAPGWPCSHLPNAQQRPGPLGVLVGLLPNTAQQPARCWWVATPNSDDGRAQRLPGGAVGWTTEVDHRQRLRDPATTRVGHRGGWGEPVRIAGAEARRYGCATRRR